MFGQSSLAARIARPLGVLFLATCLLPLVNGPVPAQARDGQVLVGKKPLPLAYRFKGGLRYLPVAASAKALDLTLIEAPKEATLTVQSPWKGTVHFLFGKQEVQVAGRVEKLSPVAIERDRQWFLTIPQMERYLGLTATLTKQQDLQLGALTRLEQTGAGYQLRSGAPLTPTGFFLDNPPRYVVNLPGAILDQKHPTAYPATEAGYSAIRLGQFEATPPVARIVYDLTDSRWRSPLVGQQKLTTLPLGQFQALQLLLSTNIRIGLAQDGSGLVLDGLHARSATLEQVSPLLLRVTFTAAEMAGSPTPYQHRPELTDTGIRRVSLVPGDNQTVVMTVELTKSAPQATLSFDQSSSRALLQLKPRLAVTPKGLEGLRGKTVVIDPGHGGRWPGAAMEPGMMGPVRLLEKDLNLRMSLDLAERLQALGIRVILTRKADTTLSEDLKVDLAARVNLATEHKADLFVSIHCNSFRKIPSDALSGTEVYFNKATDKAIAHTLFEHMASETKRGGRGALFGELRVTKHPSIPSVLVECGYMSNPEEYALFIDPSRAFEKQLMTGLTNGIVAVLTGRTTLPQGMQSQPMPDLPGWLDSLSEHMLLEVALGTSPAAPVAPVAEAPVTSGKGASDLFRLGDGPSAAPRLPMPVIPPPRRDYLPDRQFPSPTGRDPEIDFGSSTGLRPPPPLPQVPSFGSPNTTADPAAAEEDETGIPGSTPQERRWSIFSLG